MHPPVPGLGCADPARRRPSGGGAPQPVHAGSAPCPATPGTRASVVRVLPPTNIRKPGKSTNEKGVISPKQWAPKLHVPPERRAVTSFGNRVFADDRAETRSLGCLLDRVTVLIGGALGHTAQGGARQEGGRGWSEATTRRGRPMAEPPEAGEEGRTSQELRETVALPAPWLRAPSPAPTAPRGQQLLSRQLSVQDSDPWSSSSDLQGAAVS